jgi:hypothetical protein
MDLEDSLDHKLNLYYGTLDGVCGEDRFRSFVKTQVRKMLEKNSLDGSLFEYTVTPFNWETVFTTYDFVGLGFKIVHQINGDNNYCTINLSYENPSRSSSLVHELISETLHLQERRN